METPKRIKLDQRVRMGIESFMLTRLLPRDHIPGVWRWLFRMPVRFQRLGLSFLVPGNVLILTTTGRRTGRPHRAAVEYGPGPRPGSLVVMAGWDGRTDWYRNALRDSCVEVWQHGRQWEATAEPVPDTEVAEMLMQLSKVSGAGDRLWSYLSGVEIDGTEGSYLRAAPHFPSLYLKPREAAEQAAHVEHGRRLALELLDRTRRETRFLLRRLNPDLVVHQDGQAWRVRDVLGHLGAWAGEAARALEAHADSGQYVCVGGRAGYDAYNARAAKERRKWAIEEVWTEYEVCHDEFRKAVENMPAERWYVEMVYPWTERGTVEALVKRMMKHEAADHCAHLPEAQGR